MQAAAGAAAVAARFRHPAASRWAGYRAPPTWTGHAAWGRQGRGGRSRRPASNGRCKNRSLIRVRSLILPQPTAAGATAAAAAAAKRAASLSGAAAAAAAARRTSFGLTRSALALKVKAGAAAPASFVRSGKHGMAIRRVNSSDLAARRAAAAAAGAATPGASRPPALAAASAAIASGRGGKIRAGKLSPGPAVRGKAAVVLKGSVSAAPASAAAAVAVKASALLVRKVALLSKARVRSGASRKAAAVVAGARVKKARVLMRNMTLYRGRGEAGVVAGGGSGTGGGGQTAEQDKEKKQKETNTIKKARLTAEPCLFFCKFGKCSKSDEDCRFAHDKAKVAVCRAFLRGNCEKKEKCLLTHAVQVEKMPVCIYFEKGLCFTPNCPYLHVKVSRNAAVCPMFLKVGTFSVYLKACRVHICLSQGGGRSCPPRPSPS